MDTHFPDPYFLSGLVSDVHMFHSYVSLQLVLFWLAFQMLHVLPIASVTACLHLVTCPHLVTLDILASI